MKNYNYLEHKEEMNKKWVYNAINKSNILEINKKLIIKYMDELDANGLKSSSIGNRVYPIKKLALFVKKDFNEINKQDIIEFIKTFNNQNWKVQTANKLRLKNFFKWFNLQKGIKDLPECVSWIEIHRRTQTEKPKEILTSDEIKKILEKTDNQRDKTFIVLLIDSGCRISEICNLKIKDVKFDEYGALIIVFGKTGEREIRLIDSFPYLKNWLNNHPFKDNIDAPLFFGRRRTYGEPLGYIGIYEQLKKSVKLAGIKKKVTPHTFRHTKLTQMAKVLTDSELRIFSGWTKSSPMAAVYTHLNSNDVNNKILKSRGIINEDNKTEEKLINPIKCSKCNNLNPEENTFCEFCNQILDPKTSFNFNNNLIEENEKLNERLNIVEQCLKQIVSNDNKNNLFINNQRALISTSGLQLENRFYKFNVGGIKNEDKI